MKENWNNNEIQFPRFIDEARQAGAFTEEVLEAMSASMGIEIALLDELLVRARMAREEAENEKVFTRYGQAAWTVEDVQEHTAAAYGRELTDAEAENFLMEVHAGENFGLVSRVVDTWENLLHRWLHRQT